MSQEVAASRMLDFRALNTFALEKLPKTSVLRDVILIEPDSLSAADFLAKVPIWLRLADLEGKRSIDVYCS